MYERRSTPSVEAWCSDQRVYLNALRSEGVFASVEAPTGWRKEDGKLVFSPPKEFPMSYIAEQVQAPRGKLHLEPELIHLKEEPLGQVLYELAMRGHLHPVSFKTLEQPSLREVLLDPTVQRSLVLPGVVAHFRNQVIYPVIKALLSSNKIARRALVFRSAAELLETVRTGPTALFFAHKKPLPREPDV